MFLVHLRMKNGFWGAEVVVMGGCSYFELWAVGLQVSWLHVSDMVGIEIYRVQYRDVFPQFDI